MTTTCTIKGLELVRSTESGSFTLKIDAMVLQAAAPPRAHQAANRQGVVWHCRAYGFIPQVIN